MVFRDSDKQTIIWPATRTLYFTIGVEEASQAADWASQALHRIVIKVVVKGAAVALRIPTAFGVSWVAVTSAEAR
jgi:hypothetical protein